MEVIRGIAASPGIVVGKALLLGADKKYNDYEHSALEREPIAELPGAAANVGPSTAGEEHFHMHDEAHAARHRQ